MVDHRPPTPPLTTPELEHNLQQLVEHNQYHDSPQNEHRQLHMPHGMPGSAMNDPRVAGDYPPHYYEYGQYPELQDPSTGLGIGLEDHYGNSPAAYYQHDVPLQNGLPYGSMNDPPTPRSSASDGLRTRSGRSVGRNSSPQTQGRVSKASPKPRKSKAPKADKAKTPKLTAPLSILTNGMEIPVRDMDAWVNRSVEERHKEADKKKGYVVRPMNSFMLYRSAYADRTKEWCRQNNHQVVSSVSGESWPLEPPEVREKYNELARLERINHQNAHPTYKFSPSKGGPARKRKGTESEDEEDFSDFGDGEWTPSGHRRPRPRQTGSNGRDTGYPNANRTMNDPYSHAINNSSWEAPNEGLMPLESSDHYAYQYYHNAGHPGIHGLGTEDYKYHITSAPGMPYQSSLLGIPGGYDPGLMGSRSHTPSSYDPQVDPALLGYSDHALDGQDPYLMAAPSQFDEQIGDLGLFDGGAPAVGQGDWPLEHDTTTLAPEFQKFGEDFDGAT
ncbi:MAG: hypothetical protein M1820_002401 [Bogoriella megaspora]|nr:MAG: hypothetical protein M1820_002401 [Bogoriella megaspora]